MGTKKNKQKKDDNLKEKKPFHKWWSNTGYKFSTSNTVSQTDDCNYSLSVNPEAHIPSKNFKGSMDSSSFNSLNNSFSFRGSIVPAPIACWYGSQGFIGYQMMSVMYQNQLISKACSMPAKDAVRKGYNITVNDGTDVSPEIINEMVDLDSKKYFIDKNLIEFITMNRVFGIRIAMFIVDSADPEYYEKPFNIDGIAPNSYRGISQIDPQWISPILDEKASADPSSIHFYEPTWWNIAGLSSSNRVHRTHLIISRGMEEVTDLLKPTYLYGGISLVQQIYERVYAAELTANEAPKLAQSKRQKVQKTNVEDILANEKEAVGILNFNESQKDNFSTTFIGQDDEIFQHDTSLADLDTVIMTQYQLVSSIARVPATKLMGSPPKGFNSNGDYESETYREELESIQDDQAVPLLNRHYEIMIRSDIAPKFKMNPFSVSPVFIPLDSVTAKEQAEINLLDAQTSTLLIQSGVISQQDQRDRIVNDEDSGYSGLDLENEELEDFEIDPNQSGVGFRRGGVQVRKK